MAALRRFLAAALLLLCGTVVAQDVGQADAAVAGLSAAQQSRGSLWIVPSPVYRRVSLTRANSPLTVPIVGAGGTVSNAAATLSYLSPPALPAAGFTAAMSSDKKSIILNVTDIALIPSFDAAILGYGLAAPGSFGGIGFVSVTAPAEPRPLGPNNALAAVPMLGVPLGIPSSDILAGWTSPPGFPFGTITAYITPIWAGAVAPTAADPGNWTNVGAIRQKRFTQWTYYCYLLDLKIVKGVPTALPPACLTSRISMPFTVADSRYSLASGTATIPSVVRGAFYPYQIADLKGNPAKPRQMASALNFTLATDGTTTTTSVTWASNGATASVSPAATSATASAMTFASTPSGGANGSEVTVVITPSAGVTLLGLSMSVPKGAAGLLSLSFQVSNGSTTMAVNYPLVAPFPIPAFNVYAGAGIFGPGFTITQATVTGTQMSAGAALTLGLFDSSVTPQPAVSLIGAMSRRAFSVAQAGPVGAAAAAAQGRAAATAAARRGPADDA